MAHVSLAQSFSRLLSRIRPLLSILDPCPVPPPSLPFPLPYPIPMGILRLRQPFPLPHTNGDTAPEAVWRLDA